MAEIVHAVSDENGTIDPHGTAQPGDQTGKEIVRRKWYKRTGGWVAFLAPKDSLMANKAVEYACAIADSPNYGYSQPRRWTGAKSIESVGLNNGYGDFDCSSLVIECYRLAGLPVKMTGYSGSIQKLFKSTGKFDVYTDAKHLNSDDYAIKGGVWVANGHVAIQITNGSQAGYDPSPSDSDVAVKPPYVKVLGGSVLVRQGAGKMYPKLMTAHKGDLLPYLETDEDTGWYWVDTVKGVGCMTNKQKYVELVLQ